MADQRTQPTATSAPIPPGQRGDLRIHDAALEHITRRVVLDVPGTVATSSGLGRLVGAALPRAKVSVAGGHVRVRVDAATTWPAGLATTARRIRDAVHQALTHQTGLVVDAVDVTVHPTIDTNDRPTRRVQ